jgi:hypothetical protein
MEIANVVFFHEIRGVPEHRDRGRIGLHLRGVVQLHLAPRRLRRLTPREQLAELLVHFRRADPLAALGFDLCVEPLWGRTPFNSYLIVARRAA